jgi:hypothetical protein
MLIIGWIIISVAVGIAAARRFDRNGGGWFLLALLISPLIAGILLVALGKLGKQQPSELAVRLAAKEAKGNFGNIDWKKFQ